MFPLTHPTQYPKRHFDQFSRFCSAHGRVPILYNWPPLSALKNAHSRRDLDSNLTRSSLGQPKSTSKGHLDGFSRFCRAHDRDKQIDRQTDRPRYSVCNNTRPRLYVDRCGLIKKHVYNEASWLNLTDNHVNNANKHHVSPIHNSLHVIFQAQLLSRLSLSCWIASLCTWFVFFGLLLSFVLLITEVAIVNCLVNCTLSRLNMQWCKEITDPWRR